MKHLFKDKTVDLSAEKRLEDRPKSDALVTYAWQEGKKVFFCKAGASWDKKINLLLNTKDFKAKEGEVTFLYDDGGKEHRLCIVGLGEKKKFNEDVLRKSYSNVAESSNAKELKKLSIIVPARLGLTLSQSAYALTEGLLFSNYSFEEHKGKKKSIRIEKVTFVGADKKALDASKKALTTYLGVALSKDLINLNADDATPEHLGNVAKEIAKKSSSLKATVFDKKRITKEKLGLLLAVSKGSVHEEPRFIILEYKGNPKSKETTVLIGKGITYDTGGLNLKPTGSMETMKSDMGGAAIVLSTVYAASELKLKKNITAVVPSTENSIGPESFKPGDVYPSYSGITVEIGNTDAEGRLVLADAIAWSEKNLKPSRIIDVATLTGAIAVALGERCAGLFSPDDALAKKLLTASENTGEKLWRMPLIEEYKEMLKSDVADTSNIGKREGSAITAALFLQKFVEKTPWAHLDVAGVVFTKYQLDYFPKHATGYGVRLLVNFLENL